MQELGNSKTVSGKILEPTAPANPCGLVAKSYFTDSYLVYNGTAADTLTASNNITIADTNIAWESDRLYKFKRLDIPGDPDGWKNYQWIDVTDGKYFFQNLVTYRAFHCLDENCRAA